MIGGLVLVVLYILLTLEVAHRTVVALIMAGIVLLLNVIIGFGSYIELLEGIDIDTILLLMSMMIMVSILSETGFFSFIASKVLIKYFNKPYQLVVILTGLTAAVSAFIDNVTTVLIITPIVIEVCQRIRIDPRPLLVMIVFASNIGGTATLIGDPPNILIGTHADLGFMDFIYHVTPAVLAIFLVFILVVRLIFRKWFKIYYEKIEGVERSRVAYSVSMDKRRVEIVLFPFFLVIVLFILEDLLGYPPAVPALIGVGILFAMIGRDIDIDEVLHRVDWTTLVFFMAMFIIIKGVEKLGLMHTIAYGLLGFSSNMAILLVMIAWVSALISAFVDNIPFTMTMLPVIDIIAESVSYDITPLYWALSLGACLGGNGTLVGASANIVVAGIAEKHGYPISFKGFMKYGMIVTTISLIISTIYLLLRYGLS